MRLDQWLWAVRLFKSRNLASEAIKGGHVRVNGAATKPAHEAKPDEMVAAYLGPMTRTFRVLGAPRSRVGAKLVSQFAEELTPPEEFAKQREWSLHQQDQRPKGSGRPTKLERRTLDGLLEEEPLE